jgi:hypothetical protein
MAVVSKVGNLFPAYVYGLGIAPQDVEAARRERAVALATASGVLFALVLVAWVVYTQSTTAVVRQGWLGQWLSTFSLAGLQSLAFALIPIRFLDGSDLFGYSRKLWAGAYLPLAAFYVYVMFSGSPSWFSSRSEIAAAGALLVAFGILSMLTWAHFRLIPTPGRFRRTVIEATPSPELGTWEGREVPSRAAASQIRPAGPAPPWYARPLRPSGP